MPVAGSLPSSSPPEGQAPLLLLPGQTQHLGSGLLDNCDADLVPPPPSPWGPIQRDTMGPPPSPPPPPCVPCTISIPLVRVSLVHSQLVYCTVKHATCSCLTCHHIMTPTSFNISLPRKPSIQSRVEGYSSLCIQYILIH